jgi:ferredoxin
MKVSVDRTVCREYANCIVESPDVFDVDEDTGKVVLLVQPRPDQYDEVRAAAAACPVRAITLAE